VLHGLVTVLPLHQDVTLIRPVLSSSSTYFVHTRMDWGLGRTRARTRAEYTWTDGHLHAGGAIMHLPRSGISPLAKKTGVRETWAGETTLLGLEPWFQNQLVYKPS